MTVVRRLARLAADALLLELALYRALARWVGRRPDVPPGATPIGYAQLVTPVLALWIFASAAEVPLVDVLLPWDGLRVPLLVLGVWGLLWMLGLLASYRVRPHLLTDDILRVRNGGRTDIAVPLAAIASVAAVEHDLPGVVRSVHVEGDLLLVGVSSRTNVQLTLLEPTLLRAPHGEVVASRVGLWVDEPREIAALLRRARAAPLDAG